ncbi:MAG: DUF308 domain-containing protein [Anaerolineae bacterium]|nr:DUF308 domain-containing protein [Anaerolineae bacterium]
MSVNVPEKMYKTTPWWITLIEGVVATIVGIFLLTNTGHTIEVLVQLLGLFWLVGGILAIVSIFVADTGVHWFWSLLVGILGIIAGIIVLRHPLWSSVVEISFLVIFLGVVGLVNGGIDLYKAFKGGGWNSALMGIVSILFGIFLLAQPQFSARVFIALFGFIGLFGGIVMILIGIRNRNY